MLLVFYNTNHFEINNSKNNCKFISVRGLKFNYTEQMIKDFVLILLTEYFYPFILKKNISKNSLAFHHYESA